MHKIYDLYKPSPPAPSALTLSKLAFPEFIAATMLSASQLEKDRELKLVATKRMKALLNERSHSATNTVRTIQTMFKAAEDACVLERDRQQLGWLLTCVLRMVELGLKAAMPPDEDEPDDWVEDDESDDSSEDEVVPVQSQQKIRHPMRRGIVTSRQVQKPTVSVNTPDDGCKPSSNEKSEDEAVVPDTEETNEPVTPKPKPKAKPKHKRKPKNKTHSKSQSPKEELSQLPLVEEGAGTEELVKYLGQDNQSIALKDGYYIKSYFFPSKTSFNSFISVIRSAQKSIDACVFSLTDDDVADTLIAAKKRGVSVRIITDDQQAATKAADAERLHRDHGIPYKTDTKSAYMHNKYCIVDHATLINGSFNWSKGARLRNWENIMVTNVPETIKEFHDHFESLWEEFPVIE